MVPIIRREFTQAVASKAFIIGTVLGPLILFAIFAIQFLIVARGGGGAHRIAILDASGHDLAPRIAQVVEERSAHMPAFMARPDYSFEIVPVVPEQREELHGRLVQRVLDRELDGFLWLPQTALAGEGIRYEGTNATNSQVMGELRQGVQRVIQSERLRAAGIDEARLGDALQPVAMDVAQTGEDGRTGNIAAARVMAFVMAFAIYLMVIMWGQSIMMSVQEEKRDRIVELIVSSVRAKDLLFGKVIGIGSAGVLQLTIWVIAALLLLTYGTTLAAALGASADVVRAIAEGTALPRFSAGLGITFVLFFAGGFFLFATMFAVIGAMVTNTQEAQQFVFPVLMPFIIGLFIAMPATDNPNSTIALVGSFIPFTSPMVMPVRASVGGIEWLQVMGSLALLYATALFVVWLAARIYRIAIFATGKKPTVGELYRWMREA
jgi:ABC-2 type transport system permease protein